MLGIPTTDPELPKQVELVPAGVHAAGVVEHLDAVRDELVVRSLDIRGDQV